MLMERIETEERPRLGDIAEIELLLREVRAMETLNPPRDTDSIRPAIWAALDGDVPIVFYEYD